MHTAHRVYPIVSDACIIYAKSATERGRERDGKTEREEEGEGKRERVERQLPSGRSRWQTHVKCFIRVSLSPKKQASNFANLLRSKKKYINAWISYLPAAAAERGGGREASVAAGSSILRASFARRKTLSSVIQDAVDMFGAYG